MPQLLTRAFAETGDKTLPPDNDNAGFVSFLQGYTSDYELNLESGNINAKAVERPIQNALFNLITDNLLWYQTHGFMQWFSGKSGGYAQNDMIVDNGGSGNIWKPFRARKSNVTSRPPFTASTTDSNPDWEEILLPSEIKAAIPFPVNGDVLNKKLSALAVSGSKDLNTLVDKNFLVFNELAASMSLNKPTPAGSTLKGFILEVTSWTSVVSGATVTYVIQRLTTMDGQIFVRSASNTTWTAWGQQALAVDVQRGLFNWAVATGTANAITLTPTLGGAPVGAGMNLRFMPIATNTGAVKVTFGATQYDLVGRDLLALPAGAIVNANVCDVMFDGSKFILIGAAGGQFSVPTAVENNAAVTLAQLKAIEAKILSFDKIYPVGMVIGLASGFDPNAAFAPTIWQKLPEGKVIRTVSGSENPLDTGGKDEHVMTLGNLVLHHHSINLTTNLSASVTVSTSATDLGTKGTTAAGGHTHTYSGSTNTTGNHSHNGAAVPSGSHNHGGATTTSGAHSHTIQLSSNRDNTGWADGASTNSPDGTQRTSTDGNHSHGISTDGNHTHTISIGSAGNHSHTFSGNTAAIGNHTHSIVLGSHAHSVVIPSHGHAVVGDTGDTGSANPDPIPTVPEYVALICWRRTS